MTRFSWLHIGSLSNLWTAANGREVFRLLLEDLEELAASERLGALFLTGDLTATGQKEEYDFLDDLLRQIWRLEPHGAPDITLAVPGNHDIDRGRIGRLATQLLKHWSHDEELRQTFWSDPEPREEVLFGFENYERWSRITDSTNQDLRRGLLPGDYSVRLHGDGFDLGVVGLNTAFLDFSESAPGNAVLDLRQLEEVCGSDWATWLEVNDANILLTHHPPQWLNEESQRTYRSIIGHFSVHLCDSQRMHIRASAISATGVLSVGSLVPHADGDRLPGYALGTLDFESRVLRCELRGFDPSKGGFEQRSTFLGSLDRPSQSRFRSGSASSALAVGVGAEEQPEPELVLESVEIRNFRNIADLRLSFDRSSSLQGHWTCIAGVNGSGKTSILQAVCLLLLGPRRILQLGEGRLERMQRTVDGVRKKTQIHAWLRRGDIRFRLDMRLDRGPESETGRRYREMQEQWDRLAQSVIVAYGATRNLSDYFDRRYSGVSPQVRRQMTLFDPLAQVASAEVLLEKQDPNSPVFPLLERLLHEVLGDELRLVRHGKEVRFRAEQEAVSAIDLPDGFRSSLAWLSDLCVVWCETYPERAVNAKPEDISGIVLIDEVDLHLHPSLQRSLIPGLRRALPRVQWIVATHSPMVLSSFDSNEIIALDRQREDGVFELDRQILGFSVDEIYEWLMKTPPTSAALEERLAESERVIARGSEKELDSEDRDLDLLLEMSPDADPEEARRRLERRHRLLSELDRL